LSDAERKFSASAVEMLRDLDRIASTVSDMAQNGQSLLTLSGRKHDEFFLELEKCVQTILSSLARFDQAEKATAAVAAELDSALETIGEAAR
jgi:hypothetical protein